MGQDDRGCYSMKEHLVLAVCLMEKQETTAEGKREGRLQLISEALLRESG